MYSFENEKEFALNSAFASVEIEGYTISEEERNICADVLNGKLSKEEMIKIILERCHA